ncbi:MULTISPECIES: DUF1905 domain-containing protein [unclassified Cryobacterium]|uniref:DUF1905 domain-containing protein n=1 Tax=unclassified Cryobacterium TaxID=2649013 RepID=UPI001447E449|nr:MULTISPECIES: DUF1905 domain-containing protein [unclassified Cryobacterium]
MRDAFLFSAELWQWEGKSAWHFVSVPPDESEEIREQPRMPRGFGSVRVSVRIGSSTWKTSIFPDSQRGSYLLPVKKSVRESEGISTGDVVQVELKPLE